MVVKIQRSYWGNFLDETKPFKSNTLDSFWSSNVDRRVFRQTGRKEEKEDRLVILNHIVATNESFSEDDLPKVQKIYAGLNHDNAKANEKIQ